MLPYDEMVRRRRASNSRIRRQRVQAARQKVAEYLAGHPCADCGEPDVAVLDFHHVGAKDAGVSELVWCGSSWPRIAAEIAKCVVLCANDHRRHHAALREAAS